ncbi:fructosamine kinase family protein [Aestuariibacter sp. AA17]|uniref:Fructosamine kinase family protein n=1 Tax=Fluctibacter corallii TaxID=2984329 RepID=A0ABT3AA64_9ALTE|nr:fructosamine kinase family protein [Aestuariibacter sp. AA17]MCV2885172.1 fructosamine kinase family protein [Aestuariibacter sp. AA17]
MWHFISEQISQSIGDDFICDDIREVKGGDTHQNYKISDGHKRFFIKLNGDDGLPYFDAETVGLNHLRDTQLFRVPNVICSGIIENTSYLVLEHIVLQHGDEQSWYQLGVQLAHMHQQHTQEMFGWQEDNFIGRTPQPNHWHKRWDVFFAEERIGFLLQLLAEKGECSVSIERAVDSVKQLLYGHHPIASMLHGDLWSGNVGFHQRTPVLFDPAFYFGDRETDIAMTELFSRFPPSFYDGYEATWPLNEGYAYRKQVYQLYHILNHALMFGSHYRDTATSMLMALDQ